MEVEKALMSGTPDKLLPGIWGLLCIFIIKKNLRNSPMKLRVELENRFFDRKFFANERVRKLCLDFAKYMIDIDLGKFYIYGWMKFWYG